MSNLTPEVVEIKLLELAQSVLDNFIRNPFTSRSHVENYGDARLDSEGSTHTVSSFYVYDIDPCHSFTMAQEEFMDATFERHEEAYREKHGISADDTSFRSTKSFAESEQEWTEDMAALLRVVIKGTSDGADITVSLGYKDAPCFPLWRDELLFTLTYNVDELLALTPEALVSEMRKQMDEAKLKQFGSKQEVRTSIDPETGIVTWESYYRDGDLHRLDGPAVIERDPKTGIVIREEYWRDSKRHRDGGPAITWRDPATGTVTWESYWCNGELHRLDGPAVTRRDPETGAVTRKEYFLNGKRQSQGRTS